MPEVKAFVTNDLPLFHNVPFKHISGADPDLHLLDIDGHRIESIPLKGKKRTEINTLLEDLGFYRKKSKDEEVPEQFQQGPYTPKPKTTEEQHQEEEKDEL